MRMARSKNTRDHILQAAERLFAESGFDATSVDSIARAAKVNKALVYYYFKNKDDLAVSLFDDLMAGLRERAGDASDRTGLRGKIADEIEYLADRRQTLALLLMEALKQGNESTALFKAAGNLIEGELTRRGFPPPSSDGPISESRRRALVHEFFTGVMPVVAFVALRDKFCAFFGLQGQEADALFLDALERSHFRSHVEPPETE